MYQEKKNKWNILTFSLKAVYIACHFKRCFLLSEKPDPNLVSVTNTMLFIGNNWILWSVYVKRNAYFHMHSYKQFTRVYIFIHVSCLQMNAIVCYQHVDQAFALTSCFNTEQVCNITWSVIHNISNWGIYKMGLYVKKKLIGNYIQYF